jgi:hypothetical protein
VVANTFVKLDPSTPGQVVATLTSDTTFYGVAISTVSAGGTVQVRRLGSVQVTLDSGTASIGNSAILSGTSAGNAHDSSLSRNAISILSSVATIRTACASACGGTLITIEITPADRGTLVPFAQLLGAAPLASPVFTGQVTIPDLTLAAHSHLNAAGGGALTAAAIASGVFAIGQIPTGTTGTTVSLGNHLHAGVYAPLASPVFTGALMAPVITTIPTGSLFVFAGDSRTAIGGDGLAAGTEYPAQLVTLSNFAGHGTVTNVGLGGQTCAQMATAYTASVHPLRPISPQVGYIFVDIGINDVLAGTASATVSSCVTTYWATAAADGFRVVGHTIFDSAAATLAQEVVRTAVNNTLRKAANTVSFFIDVELVFPPSYNNGASPPPFWNDQTHLNVAGNLLRAQYENAAMSFGSPILSPGQPDLITPPSGFYKVNGVLMASGVNSSIVPSAALAGDLASARSATSGVAFFGSDSLGYIFRNGLITTLQVPTGGHTEVPTGAFAVGGNVGGGFSTGDLSASRTANTGAVFFGTDGLGYVYRDSATDIQTPLTFTSQRFNTTNNCSSSATPAVCGSASSGSVAVPAAATSLVVATTAVTGVSQIMLTFDSSLGSKLGVTCNTTQPALFGLSARATGSGFTMSATASTTNAACFSYTIVN